MTCSGGDGSPIEIEITDPPDFGTLDPPGVLPIGAPRSYRANADAAGKTDVITLHAVAGKEPSNDVTIKYSIGPVNRAPVCADVAFSMPAGTSMRVPFASCSDADGEYFDVVIQDGPTHGVFDFDTQRYSPAAGFTGQDTMTFRAIDWWHAWSELRVIRITVTSALKPTSQPPPSSQPGSQPSYGRQPSRQVQPDLTSPTLGLLAPSSLSLRRALRRGIPVTATTNEAGRIVIRAFVTRRAARRFRVDRRARGAVAVASLERDIATGRTALRLKPSRKARRRLKHATRLKLRIVATLTDAAGNARRQTVRIVARRSARTRS